MDNRSTERPDLAPQTVHRQERTRFPAVSLVASGILLVLFVIEFSVQQTRITQLEQDLSRRIESEVRRQRATELPTELAQRLMNELQFVKDAQTAVLATSKDVMERMYFVFATVGAFFGIFSLYFAYRQVTSDSRQEETREQHDQEMRGLVASFQKKALRKNW